jgi:hypothetical protein
LFLDVRRDFFFQLLVDEKVVNKKQHCTADGKLHAGLDKLLKHTRLLCGMSPLRLNYRFAGMLDGKI